MLHFGSSQELVKYDPAAATSSQYNPLHMGSDQDTAFQYMSTLSDEQLAQGLREELKTTPTHHKLFLLKQTLGMVSQQLSQGRSVAAPDIQTVRITYESLPQAHQKTYRKEVDEVTKRVVEQQKNALLTNLQSFQESGDTFQSIAAKKPKSEAERVKAKEKKKRQAANKKARMDDLAAGLQQAKRETEQIRAEKMHADQALAEAKSVLGETQAILQSLQSAMPSPSRSNTPASNTREAKSSRQKRDTEAHHAFRTMSPAASTASQSNYRGRYPIHAYPELDKADRTTISHLIGRNARNGQTIRTLKDTIAKLEHQIAIFETGRINDEIIKEGLQQQLLEAHGMWMQIQPPAETMPFTPVKESNSDTDEPELIAIQTEKSEEPLDTPGFTRRKSFSDAFAPLPDKRVLKRRSFEYGL